jgi:hypothetical protein
MAFSFWKDLPSKIKRVLTIVTWLVISVVITIAGVLTPLSMNEAQDIQDELEQIRANVSVQYIFGNNFMLCLIMFIPVIGPIFGGYVLYNTGVVIAAQSITAGLPPLLVFFSLFIFPFAWLEFLAYSTALAESAWLIRRMIQYKVKKELINACILIAITAIALLVAAIIEIALILYLGG